MNTPAHRDPMHYDDALAVARLWSDIGGRREVELGALEPLLWREGPHTAPDLVQGLVALGFRVTMTTNASMLRDVAVNLKQAGLALLRVSWHTTDPTRYQQISGRGNYDRFREGLEAAARARLPISFNRVLLKGFTCDLPDQLDFIEGNGFRLKLYDLMWTPEINEYYDTFYQDWRPIIRQYVLPRAIRVERSSPPLGRKRLRFYLKGGALVEVKIGDRIDRSCDPCNSCSHKAKCLEVFGDYLRVEPELQAYCCYLRRDISFDLSLATKQPLCGRQKLKSDLQALLGSSFARFVESTTLRFIVTPYCNYNCLFPGTSISWCHKTTGDYSFPSRPSQVATFRTQAGEPLSNGRLLSKMVHEVSK